MTGQCPLGVLSGGRFEAESPYPIRPKRSGQAFGQRYVMAGQYPVKAFERDRGVEILLLGCLERPLFWPESHAEASTRERLGPAS